MSKKTLQKLVDYREVDPYMVVEHVKKTLRLTDKEMIIEQHLMPIVAEFQFRDRYSLISAIGDGAGDNLPMVIKLNWNKPSKTVLVGKGITFDSGGYDMKDRTCSINQMWDDKAGAMVALYTAKKLGIPAIVAFTPNLVSDTSMLPGQIVKAKNGLNIHIADTDAEGRLLLADLMTEAYTKFDNVIAIATLTGSAAAFLGKEGGGLVHSDFYDVCLDGHDEVFWTSFASLITHQRHEDDNFKLWPAPKLNKKMVDKVNKCTINGADLSNYVGGVPGSQTAYEFLLNFKPATKGSAKGKHSLTLVDMAAEGCNDDGNYTGFGYNEIKWLYEQIES